MVNLSLSTNYLGLRLDSPVIASSSPLAQSLEGLLELEAAGAAAVTLRPIFGDDVTAPEGDEPYQLELVKKAKEHLKVPVIASLSAAAPGIWQRQARQLVDAGADALELRLYSATTDVPTDASAAELVHLAAIEAVKIVIEVPLAVKLSPSYSAIPAFADKAIDAGADGLVLFDRFHGLDIDLDSLELLPGLEASRPADQRVALRWLGVLRPQLPDTYLACGTGVHSGDEVFKALLMGADAVTTASAVALRGAVAITEMAAGLSGLLTQHGFGSLDDARGQLCDNFA